MLYQGCCQQQQAVGTAAHGHQTRWGWKGSRGARKQRQWGGLEQCTAIQMASVRLRGPPAKTSMRQQRRQQYVFLKTWGWQDAKVSLIRGTEWSRTKRRPKTNLKSGQAVGPPDHNANGSENGGVKAYERGFRLACLLLTCLPPEVHPPAEANHAWPQGLQGPQWRCNGVHQMNQAPRPNAWCVLAAAGKRKINLIICNNTV